MPPTDQTTTVNFLHWITSLAVEERGITDRILEDLRPYLASVGMPFVVHEPRSSSELVDILDQIAAQARQGQRPILHFDLHGSESEGLKIAATGQFISWLELAERLRAINIATLNSLCVISSVCFGMKAVSNLDVSKAAPFYLLVAPEVEVTAGFLEKATLPFYRTAFESFDLIDAARRHLAPAFGLFHCQGLLKFLLLRYVRDDCTGQGARRRRERLFTLAAQKGYASNRASRRAVRARAKAFTRPDEAMFKRFEKFASSFLVGRDLGFDMREVGELAAQSRLSGDTLKPWPTK